jgi:two-component system sensor histidine kinase KdpD
VLGARPEPDRKMDAPTMQTLSALADQAGVALERVRLAHEAARAAAMDETQTLRTALLNSLSHDLRTPLTGIRGAAETLMLGAERISEADRQDLLASIQQDTARMTKFLSNIMDLTRLESGAIQPRLGPVPLADLIDAAIARVPGLDAVAVNLAPALPDALADAALLEQVLVNVLDNAQRYAPAGSLVRVSAQVAHGTPHGRITIEVADEGVGIAAADLPHVFDSFYRARRGDRTAPGTGLGLAIARGLMQAMDGGIEAASPRPDAPRDGSPGTVIVLSIDSVQSGSP